MAAPLASGGEKEAGRRLVLSVLNPPDTAVSLRAEHRAAGPHPLGLRLSGSVRKMDAGGWGRGLESPARRRTAGPTRRVRGRTGQELCAFVVNPVFGVPS